MKNGGYLMGLVSLPPNLLNRRYSILYVTIIPFPSLLLIK